MASKENKAITVVRGTLILFPAGNSGLTVQATLYPVTCIFQGHLTL